MSWREQSRPSPRPPRYPCLGVRLTIPKTTMRACWGRTSTIAKTSLEVHVEGGFSNGWGSSLQAHQGGTLAITKTSPKIHGVGGLGNGWVPSLWAHQGGASIITKASPTTHAKGGLGDSQGPSPQGHWGGTPAIVETSMWAHQGGTSAIAKTSLQILMVVEKKQKGTPPSSQVPLLFWALTRARWSSSNQTIATSK